RRVVVQDEREAVLERDLLERQIEDGPSGCDHCRFGRLARARGARGEQTRKANQHWSREATRAMLSERAGVSAQNFHGRTMPRLVVTIPDMSEQGPGGYGGGGYGGGPPPGGGGQGGWGPPPGAPPGAPPG